MTIDLGGRSFLKEADFTPQEWAGLLDLASELKAAKRAGTERPSLLGRNIALIFEKTSTRTRCAFEVGAHDQGAHVTYLDPAGSQLGHKESVKDTARVLGRMFDGIEYRGFGQDRVEELAAYAHVPVWNGLTDEWHPTQMLADQLTMREHSERPLSELSIAYVGDARFNEGNSTLVASALSGMDVRIVAPSSLQCSEPVRQTAQQIAAETGAKITVTDSLDAVEGADFVSTDVWVSMGESKQVWAERIEALRDYQVNARLLARTGNPQVKVLHCLPAFHDLGTAIGREIHQSTGMTALEITDEVFEANAQVIFDEAENRMHTIKAVMVATLGARH
ncbi:ornithine carbamoyltransferase [Propionibacterium cyclohexanicum]|uniref:Ornithine carbamoyltransferase n=1 Tax=Propionibacterium cyclohexanicum TaxID=64702 RepID=A0A1H9SF67_9ACTN|nr:ornithine carbamoyltransferase [Propionibacterium cyclohexanicum]SER83670.1 ornithine carbamoyltransferase [Propionibacterium cyclohexanicum]